MSRGSLSLSDELSAYVDERVAGRAEALRAVERDTAALGSKAVMQTNVAQAALLELLTRTLGALRAIEVGTFTGYGAIRIARGLRPGAPLPCRHTETRRAAPSPG